MHLLTTTNCRCEKLVIVSRNQYKITSSETVVASRQSTTIAIQQINTIVLIFTVSIVLLCNFFNASSFRECNRD